LRHQFPDVTIVTVIDRHEAYRRDVAAERRAEIQHAFASGEFTQPPKNVAGGQDTFFLRMAEQHGAVVVSNDTFGEYLAEFPWLSDGDRLLGADHGKLGWTFVPCASSTPKRAASRSEKPRSTTASAFSVGRVPATGSAPPDLHDLDVRVGDTVICPDGLSGVVARIDAHDGRIRVEGWHEWFTLSELGGLD